MFDKHFQKEQQIAVIEQAATIIEMMEGMKLASKKLRVNTLMTGEMEELADMLKELETVTKAISEFANSAMETAMHGAVNDVE